MWGAGGTPAVPRLAALSSSGTGAGVCAGALLQLGNCVKSGLKHSDINGNRVLVKVSDIVKLLSPQQTFDMILVLQGFSKCEDANEVFLGST